MASTVVVPGAAPGQPLWVSLRALPPSGATSAPTNGVVVGDRQVDDRVDIAAADVIPQAPLDVTIARAPTATTDRYPTMTVTIRAPGAQDALFKIGASSRTFKLFAASPFTTPTFDYKVDWIDKNTGDFDPIAGAFHSATTTSLVIDPQAEPRAS
jgi:hypothetical protein